MVRVLVPVKRVVDYSVRIFVKKDKSGVETNGVKMSLNPFDEVSMELAMQLKEKNLVNEVISLTVGPSSAQKVIHQTLASGADRAIHIVSESEANFEPLHIAKIIKSIADNIQPDLIILGKQAIDDDFNQTGQILAGLLNWPQATYLSSVELLGEKALRVEREIDGGLEQLELPLPAVVTTDLRLNTPRFTTIQNIIKAKKKPIESINIEQLNIEHTPRLSMLQFDEPPPRGSGTILSSVEQLAKIIKDTGTVSQ